MDCPRCKGTMVVDHFVDIAASGEIWMSGWRCLMCGEIVDPLITNNREQQVRDREAVGASPLAVSSQAGPESSE